MSAFEQKIINEEYKIWRKNVPYNYDLLFTHALSWPSLSVQFYPSAQRNEASTTQQILLSTHTSGADQEYITIAQITLPDTITDASLETLYKSDTPDSRLKIIQEIPVIDEINRCRYSPFSTNVVALRSDLSDIHVYDTTLHKSKSTEVKQPDLVLKGHTKGGYGLSWSVMKNGHLLTSGEDSLVCLFDVNGSNEAVSKFNQHESVVNDCCFSYHNQNLFVSVGDDKKIVSCDIRTKDAKIRKNTHDGDVFCVNYHPIEEFMLCTGGKDGFVKVWDERNMEKELYAFDTGSNNEVLQVAWSPHVSNLLASAGTNRRVLVWDVSRVGMELNEEEKQDGPPELLFMHGGHTDSVCDFSWNPLEPYEIVSVAEDNIMQVWQMTGSEIPYDLED
ncbi:hypothetical protein BDAP_001383 [Binucleata daphniae]